MISFGCTCFLRSKRAHICSDQVPERCDEQIASSLLLLQPLKESAQVYLPQVLPCLAMPCSALPFPALPCPALPCPALP